MSIWKISARRSKSIENLFHPYNIEIKKKDKFGLQIRNSRHYNSLETSLSIDFDSIIVEPAIPFYMICRKRRNENGYYKRKKRQQRICTQNR